MRRLHNFSPGPAALPTAVIEQIRNDLDDWNGQGSSVMEISHRGPAFVELAEASEQRLRDLLQLPDNFHVLFMQGGAATQFVLVPMNLGIGSHLVSGHWSAKAFREAGKVNQARLLASGESLDWLQIPEFCSDELSDDSAYLQICSNETIHGLQFQDFPQIGEIPLIADMSSDLLTRPLNFESFGIIFACAQKNFGISGLTLALVRDDVLQNCKADLPAMFSYQQLVAKQSMENTPPTFAWYVADLMFRWITDQGGLEEMQARSQRKANAIYQFIDQDDFYINHVRPVDRSQMNVPFRISDQALEPLFLEQANAAGLISLKGHRVVGGIRVNIYNGVSEASVQVLVDFMQYFREQNQ